MFRSCTFIAKFLDMINIYFVKTRLLIKPKLKNVIIFLILSDWLFRINKMFHFVNDKVFFLDVYKQQEQI